MLGVSEDASEADIKKAYRKLAMVSSQYHGEHTYRTFEISEVHTFEIPVDSLPQNSLPIPPSHPHYAHQPNGTGKNVR